MKDTIAKLYSKDLTQQKIAEILGISRGTVAKCLRLR